MDNMVKDNIQIINSNRNKIYDFILRRPGVYLSEISRRLSIPKSTVNYHINYLESRGLISSELNCKYKRFYDAHEIGKRDKKFLNLLMEEVPSKIIIYLFSHPNSSQVNLSKFLNKHPTTISFHLDKLKNADMLEINPNGNKIQYKLKNPETLLDLSLKYGDNFLFDFENRKIDLMKNAVQNYYNSNEMKK